MATDDRPIITCAGNQSLFASVHPYIVDALPLQKVEWQRSYGRPVKKVRLCGHFVPFDVHQLPRKFNEHRLLKDPVLHLYWIDCDIDMYKKRVRDDLFMWQSALKALSISDWLIIVVAHDENKVKTKILRTSVYDKVKNEFSSRNSNRCVLFSEPFRNDTKSEAWTLVISRVQELMLTSFSRVIAKFEDAMRLERERRTEDDWTFTKYFMLQESLAKFYNVIELYEDALVQYDELDALFAQFIVNHSVGAMVEWLAPYSVVPSSWEGVSMSTDVNLYKHMLISEGKPSLLDLRNYMFSRQCQLLIQLERPSELSSRSLKFIHNTIHELRLLEVSMPAGAVFCWVFLTCKELLTVCEPFKDTLGMEVYSTYTSHLWTCLQSVTHKLGCLCGLLPGAEPTSKELHSVVELIAGISGTNTAGKSSTELRPQERLRRVLSSSQDFCSYYVELTELTMGTLKYIGHTRMAKILGQQLAKFYMSSKQPQQAEPFLLDCLQLFTNDQWTSLELDTWAQLALCEELIGHHAAYIRACLKVASHTKTPYDRRVTFTNKILEFQTPTDWSGGTVTVLEDCSLSVVSHKFNYDLSSRTATLHLHLESKLPLPFSYDSISLLILPCVGMDNSDKPSRSIRTRKGSPLPSIPLTQCSHITEHGETAVGLTCIRSHSLLTHKDSSNTGHMIRNLSKGNADDLDLRQQETSASLPAGQLEAGDNELVFTLQEPSLGMLKVHQVRLQRPSIDLYSAVSNCTFTVCGLDMPSVRVDTDAVTCYMGTSNTIACVVDGNHCFKLPQVSSSLATTNILGSKDVEEAVRSFDLCVTPNFNSITPGTQSVQVDLAFSEALMSTDKVVVAQQIECHCPIEISSKTFTAREEKFIQITVFSLIKDKVLHVQQPTLTSKGDFTIGLDSLNGSDEASWVLSNSSQLSFLWRLQPSHTCNSDSIRCSFSLQFTETEADWTEPCTFTTDISIDIVKTQFIMTRYIKSGIPMSPLSLSRQSSQDAISSSLEIPTNNPLTNTWQALCECEMLVELKACGDLDLTDEQEEGQRISYEIISDPNWAISGSKHGFLEITNETLLSSIGIKLMPLTGGHLWLPEVRLRNSKNEEFLPGQVYDNSKLTQVFINNLE